MTKKKKYLWLTIAVLVTSPLLFVPIAGIIPLVLLAVLMITLGTDLYEKITIKEGTSTFYKALLALIITGVFASLTIFIPYYLIKFSGFGGV